MDLQASVQSLEIDGIDFISRLKPFSPNLFMASSLVAHGTTADNDTELPKGEGNTLKKEGFGTNLNSAKYRIQKIQLPGLKLTWNEIGTGQKYPTISGIVLSTECRITWIEDHYKVLDRFHRIWLNNWYSRESGRFKVGVAGKFKDLNIHIYDYISTLDQNFMVTESVRELYTIKIRGLAPTDLKDIVYGYTEDGDQTVEYSYKVFEAVLSSKKIDNFVSGLENTHTKVGPAETEQLKGMFSQELGLYI